MTTTQEQSQLDDHLDAGLDEELDATATEFLLEKMDGEFNELSEPERAVFYQDVLLLSTYLRSTMSRFVVFEYDEPLSIFDSLAQRQVENWTAFRGNMVGDSAHSPRPVPEQTRAAAALGLRLREAATEFLRAEPDDIMRAISQQRSVVKQVAEFLLTQRGDGPSQECEHTLDS